ncbi:MAG: rubrerythrin family protein [Bacteroidota bacterium]
MNSAFNKLIDEAIHLELKVSDLYLLFYRQFPDESQFWWELSNEEENHAALLKTIKLMGDVDIDIPKELFPKGIEDLIKANLDIQAAYEDFEKHPDRTKAFQFAYRLETSAGEMHFNAFMTNTPGSAVSNVFKSLNGDDIDHAERIRKFMINHQIPLEE